MKNSKKLLASLLAFGMILSLAACGGGGTTTPEDESKAPENSTAVTETKEPADNETTGNETSGHEDRTCNCSKSSHISCKSKISVNALIVALVGFDFGAGGFEFVARDRPYEARVVGLDFERAAFGEGVGLGFSFETHVPAFEVVEAEPLHVEFADALL